MRSTRRSARERTHQALRQPSCAPRLSTRPSSSVVATPARARWGSSSAARVSTALVIQHPLARRPYCPRRTTLLILRRASRALHTVGGLLALCCCCIGIGGGVFFYMKQKKASSSTNTATELATAPQQIAVIVSQPGAPAKQAAAPQSLAALLAACGLEHRAQAFEDEGYTLDVLISSLKQGEQVAKSDLRELKLTLGECRELITKLQDSM